MHLTSPEAIRKVVSRRGFLQVSATFLAGLVVSCNPISSETTGTLIPATESDASKVARLGWERALTEEGKKVEERLTRLGLSPAWHSLVSFETLNEKQRGSLRLPNSGYFVFAEGDKESVMGFIWKDDGEGRNFTMVPRRVVNLIPTVEDADLATPEVKIIPDLSKFITWESELRPGSSYNKEWRFHRTEYEDLGSYLKTPNFYKEVQIRGPQDQLTPVVGVIKIH